MKKTRITTLLLLVLATCPSLNAQGFLGKLKDKLENAAVPKGAFYYYYENIEKKEKSKDLRFSQSLTVIDANTLAWKGTSKYGGDPDKTYKKIDMPTMAQPVFNDGDFHNTIIKIQDDVFLKVYFQGISCEIQFLKNVEVFALNKDFIKQIINDDTCESYKKLETAIADFVKANDAINSAKKAAENKADAQRVAQVKLPIPTNTKPCNQAKLKELCQSRVGNDKILYCYFAVPDMLKQVSPNNEWKMIKEKKMVNGTYDDFITKRRIFAICVYQTEDNVKDGVYNHTCITIEEEHAFNVWDGTKFNGTLKATGTMYLGHIAKDNALKYKSVLP